jgi:hypothetical protein
MVFNSKMISALGVNGSYVLLDFLEAAFDFPSCGEKLNHLFSRKCQVCGDARKCEAFVIDKYDLDLVSEGFGHAEEFGKFHRPLFAANMDLGRSGRASQFCGKLLDGSETVSEFGWLSAFADNNARKFEKPCVDAEPCEEFDRKGGVFPDLVKERPASKPTVADDESGMVEKGNYPENKFRADAGFCLEPFGMGKPGTCFDRFLKRHVKFLCERKACPSSVPEKKESGEYPAVDENPLGRILFGRMVVMSGASGNLFSGLAVKGVVQGDQKPSGDIGNWNHVDKKFPQGVPRQLAGVEEIIEFPGGDVFREKDAEFSENAADAPCPSAGTECGEKRFENAPAVEGYGLGGFVEKFGEFHLRLPGLVKGYMHITAYSFISSHGLCCL